MPHSTNNSIAVRRIAASARAFRGRPTRPLLPRARFCAGAALDRTFAIKQLVGGDDTQIIEQRLGARALHAQSDVAVGPYVYDLGLCDAKQRVQFL